MAVLSLETQPRQLNPTIAGCAAASGGNVDPPVILTRLDSRANGTRWRACSLSAHHTTFPQRRRKQRRGAAPHNHSDIVLPRTSTSILLAYAPSQSGSYSCTSRPLYSERPDALAPTHAQHYIQSSTARCNAQIYSGLFSMNSEATATNLVLGDNYGSCAPNEWTFIMTSG